MVFKFNIQSSNLSKIEIIIAIFVIGYICITLEHSIKIDKAATAIVTGTLCWTVFMIFNIVNYGEIQLELEHHLVEIAEILFFLLGAMTIVELVDAHQGFDIITGRIKTLNKIRHSQNCYYLVHLFPQFDYR